MVTARAVVWFDFMVTFHWVLRNSQYGRVFGCGYLYAHALGVYGCAAVPRAGLWPATPPLCRYAVHTKRMGSEYGGLAVVQTRQAGG